MLTPRDERVNDKNTFNAQITCLVDKYNCMLQTALQSSSHSTTNKVPNANEFVPIFRMVKVKTVVIFATFLFS